MRALVKELFLGLFILAVVTDSWLNGPRREAIVGVRIRRWLDTVGLRVPPSQPTRTGVVIQAAIHLAFVAVGLVLVIDASIGIARQLL